MVKNHGKLKDVQTVSISKFKASCLALMEKVRRTGEPILVTRRGEPVAQVGPPPDKARGNWLGYMKGTGAILGDVVSPAADEDDWEALHG